MNLLIVDDYAGNRKLLRAQLESEGHAIVEAANGVEALAALEESAFDAVISDILMPNMDGFRLCREIRSSEKHQAMPLVLYTSTYNSPGDRQLADTVGADCYVLKPAPTAVILKAVEDASTRARSRSYAGGPTHDEAYVLKQYNEALVRKLEDTNAELTQTLEALHQAHGQILKMNRELEERVTHRTAALNAVNQELEAFSYSVSHDLRAPLRHISAFAHRVMEARDAPLGACQAEDLARIIASTQYMGQLIEDLLSFSRMGKAQMQLSQVDLNTLGQEAIDRLKPECEGRAIEWIKGALPVVWCDSSLLRQVFINLISNAIKYSRPRAPARIEIGCSQSAQGDPVIFVRDNGVGFDMKYADKLFGVFQRLHRADEFEGTGIGLANAQRIVARHGGRIWAESVQGAGTTVSFSLPAALPAA